MAATVPPVLTAVALLVTGALALAVGAEGAVRGATRLGRARGVPPFVLGALLFGVDLESVGAAVTASARGESSIAAGEAFGTIVFLFAAGFGLALLISRRPVPSPGSLMVLLPAAGLVLGAIALTDLVVTRREGLLLLGAYALYVSAVLQEGRTAAVRGAELEREAGESRRVPVALLIVGGLALLSGGAVLLVSGGVRLAASAGLASGFVGGAVVGALASLDEVLLEVLPIVRGNPGLATGNLFGTAAAFSTGALGLAAVVRPLVVDTAATSAFLAASALYAIVAAVFLWRGRVGRLVGVALLLIYAGWLAFASRL